MSGEEAGGVDTTMRYVIPGERAVFYPTDRERSYMPFQDHPVRIESMRPAAASLSLERNGFVLLTRPTAVENFYDADEVKRVYYPEIEALVKELLGAEKVVVFGDVARSDDPATKDGGLPSFGAHVDYQERTVRDFARQFLGPEEAERRLTRRFIEMNLWRPIKTVERTPLAVCDASTVAQSDLNESEIIGGLNDPNRPPMYGFNLAPNPNHRWYYAPRMRPDEILAFKLFDSDPSALQWTGHSAFTDPTAAPDAPPRESMEVRTIAFLPE